MKPIKNYFNDNDYSLLEQCVSIGNAQLAEKLLQQKQMTQDMLKKIFFYIFTFRPSYGNTIMSKILAYQQIEEDILNRYAYDISLNNLMKINLLIHQKLSVSFILKNIDYYKDYIAYMLKYQSINIGLAKLISQEIFLLVKTIDFNLKGIDTSRYYFNITLYNEIKK